MSVAGGLGMLATDLAAGRRTAREVAEEALDRAARSQLGAFISLDADAVIEQAAAADRAFARGELLGALHGVPVAVKDNIQVAGAVTSGGTRALAADVASRDATVVARLRAAGAVIFGKTALHELSMGWTGANRSFGSTRNPLDPARHAGGSSGGSAAAVADGIVSAAIGTDTNGSIRIPAAFCGVSGFRPSPRRYPSDGIIPLAPSLDTVGAIAGSAADLRLIDAALRGRRPERVRQRPLVVVVEPRLLAGATGPVAAAVDGALLRLSARGVRVVELGSPKLSELVTGLPARVIGAEAAAAIADYAHSRGIDPARLVRLAGVEIGRALGIPPPAPEQRALASARVAVRRLVTGLLERSGASALLYPTARIVAPPVLDRFDAPAPDLVVDGRTVRAGEAYGRNVAVATVAGLPAVTIPVAAGTLSAGIELAGRTSGDAAVLDLATALEPLLEED